MFDRTYTDRPNPKHSRCRANVPHTNNDIFVRLRCSASFGLVGRSRRFYLSHWATTSKHALHKTFDLFAGWLLALVRTYHRNRYQFLSYWFLFLFSTISTGVGMCVSWLAGWMDCWAAWIDWLKFYCLQFINHARAPAFHSYHYCFFLFWDYCWSVLKEILLWTYLRTWAHTDFEHARYDLHVEMFDLEIADFSDVEN